MTTGPDNPQPNFVTCKCHHCDGGIEFDASEFEKGETRTVECPHCGLDTIIFVTPQQRGVSPITSTDDLRLRREELLRKTSDKGEAPPPVPAAPSPEPPLIPAALSPEEKLTPNTFAEFYGQNRAKARLEVSVAAAKSRGEALGHVLLVGPPRSGKATLAGIIVRAMGANLKSTTGSAIEKAGDLIGLLTNLEEGEVLFIDEIHRLRHVIAEYLYAPMADFKMDVIIDQGPNARSIRLNLPRCTLIGTTPRKERLNPELVSCFSIIENMDAYSVRDLDLIAWRFAKLLEFKIDQAATERIARSADGTPLDVLRRVRHVRDFAHVAGSSENVTAEVAEEALKLLSSVDEAKEATENRAAIPSEVRREVWRRDGGKCVRCGGRERLEYDHIIPVSQGGSNTVRNIELLCETCNRSKGDTIQ